MVHKKKQRLWLLVPHLCLVGLLLYGLIQGGLGSLGWIPAFGLKDIQFNYFYEVLFDKRFWSAAVFSITTAVISSTLAVLIGLWICYRLMNLSQKDLARVNWVIQIPIIIPHIIVCMFIIQLFSRAGILSRLSYQLGLEEAGKFWGKWVFNQNGVGVILAYLWKGIPFVIFTCLPMMLNISNHLGEAARTLGANNSQQFMHVTLPLCRKTIILDHIILLMFALGGYDIPKILGATFPKALPILAYEEYIHPDLLNRPRAMALNMMIFIVGIVILILYGIILKLLTLERRRS